MTERKFKGVSAGEQVGGGCASGGAGAIGPDILCSVFASWVYILVMFVAASSVTAATLTGKVKDASGEPISNARIDHIGKIVVVPETSLGVAPSPDEIRTDADGYFRVTTNVPAVVVRKPGYASQRMLIAGDAEVQIVLQKAKEASLCKISPAPKVKTKPGNDVDYTATWYYIDTKNGPQGILSGRGPSYSFGAPDETHVRTSTEYLEVMSESGMIDASGHSSDGKYWRSRSIFGAAAQYFNVSRETAEQLDCVMDHIKVP